MTVPRRIGENRESGEIPELTRNCNKRERLAFATIEKWEGAKFGLKPGDLPHFFIICLRGKD